jgi:hypothetical protein
MNEDKKCDCSVCAAKALWVAALEINDGDMDAAAGDLVFAAAIFATLREIPQHIAQEIVSHGERAAANVMEGRPTCY